VPTSIHLVFYIKLVRLVATDLFLSQLVDDSQPLPLLVNGEEEYDVEQILAVRRRKIGRGYRDEALVK
jgi:hypothetical protein